jgi:hypothetical protein
VTSGVEGIFNDVGFRVDGGVKIGVDVVSGDGGSKVGIGEVLGDGKLNLELGAGVKFMFGSVSTDGVNSGIAVGEGFGTDVDLRLLDCSGLSNSGSGNVGVSAGSILGLLSFKGESVGIAKGVGLAMGDGVNLTLDLGWTNGSGVA